MKVYLTDTFLNMFIINRDADQPRIIPAISLNQSIHSAVLGAKYMGCSISTAPPRSIGMIMQIKINANPDFGFCIVYRR